MVENYLETLDEIVKQATKKRHGAKRPIQATYWLGFAEGIEKAQNLFSVFQKDYDKEREQLSELMKKCPLVPTLYNMTVLERSRLLAEHSIALDEWYHNLKKELLEAQK